MNDTTNLDIIKSAYAAFGRGDIPAILAICDPASEWEVPGSKELPWAGNYRGRGFPVTCER